MIKFRAPLVIILFVGLAWGQAPKATPHPRNSDSLKIGTLQLNLGVSQKEVLVQVVRAGYKTLDLASEGGYTRVAVTDRDLTDKVQSAMAAVDNDGVLYFQNAELVRIQHKVTEDTATGRDRKSTRLNSSHLVI